MARVDQGDSLSGVILQPGAKFSDDGYDLVIGTCTFKAAQTASVGSTINRGSACPVSTYSYCKAHKFTVTFDALGVATYVVDYVGIWNNGTITEPQVGGSQGLSSEHISTHPNFFALATGFSGSPIAGVGSGTTTTPNFPVVTEGGITEYYGNNGSRFSAPEGNKFLGFKKAQYAGYYGKTNYLAPQTSFSGHFYTTSTANITNLRDRVGKTSGTNEFSSIPLVPSYVGTTFVNGTKNQLLLAQLAFEDFGSLYKVTYEVRYNREGYEPAVYATA
jgi:hypothetical protein